MAIAPTAIRTPAGDHPSLGIEHVGVCIDGSPISKRVIPHALAVARAFHASLTVISVLEPHGRASEQLVSTSALEWETQRSEARQRLTDLAMEYGVKEQCIEDELLEGRPAEEICRWATDHHIDLTVLCSHGESGWTAWSLGSTAKKLVEGLSGLVLLVPAAALQQPPPRELHYERIIVPLDGSLRAESALPVAGQIARAHGAEMVLLHAVPVPEVTRVGPPDEEGLTLERRLVDHNRRVGERYLEETQERLSGSAHRAETVLVEGDDVRFGLLRSIQEARASLVVMSAHGRSGLGELPLGNIARFLIENTTAPVLLVRDLARRTDSWIAGRPGTESARLPSQAAPT